MLLCFLAELPVLPKQARVDGADVVLERGVAGEETFAENALEGLQLHVNALCVVLKVRNRLKCFSTV